MPEPNDPDRARGDARRLRRDATQATDRAQLSGAEPMRWSRFVISMLTATVLVLGALALGLHYYYKPQAVADGERAFEIQYLTPEEAAALLGGEPERFGTPRPVPAGDPSEADHQPP